MTKTGNETMCEWFVMCTRPAGGYLEHPELGWVPTCEKCAQLVLGANVEAVETVMPLTVDWDCPTIDVKL